MYIDIAALPDDVREYIKQLETKVSSLEQHVAEIVEQNKRLKTSPVTNLKNVNGYAEDLREIKSLLSGTSVSVVEIDADFLKSVNDTYGHEMGDLYLKTLAEAMVEVYAERMDYLAYDAHGNMYAADGRDVEKVKDEIRTKFIYHNGGDEFRIVLKHPKPSKDTDKAQYLRDISAGNYAFMTDIQERAKILWRKARGRECTVDASFGYGIVNSEEPIAQIPQHVQKHPETDPQLAFLKQMGKIGDSRAMLYKTWAKVTKRVALRKGRGTLNEFIQNLTREDPTTGKAPFAPEDIENMRRLNTKEQLFEFIAQSEAPTIENTKGDYHART